MVHHRAKYGFDNIGAGCLKNTLKEIDMEKEIRNFNIPVEVVERDGQRMITGYPIVYNKDSEDMGFIERIAPGAAKKALKRSDIRALKNHDPNLIFGRQGVNLKFTEDKDGLYYEASEIDTQTYRQVAEEVRLGLLTGQSFGFTIIADEWTDLDTDKPKRTITEIGQIYDVGPVTYPAYTDTSVALRSLEKAKTEKKPEFEQLTITIQVPGFIEEKSFDINDRENIVNFIDKITKELRSASNPTVPVADIAADEPTLDKSPDVDNTIDPDKTMERMDKTLERYRKKGI